MRLAAVALGLMMAAGPGWADEPAGLTGMQLKTMCDGGAGRWGEGGCLAYIIGFTEGMEFGGMMGLASTGLYSDYSAMWAALPGKLTICRPDNSTNEQARLVVVKFLSDHPERLHEGAKFLVAEAFSSSFPCP